MGNIMYRYKMHFKKLISVLLVLVIMAGTLSMHIEKQNVVAASTWDETLATFPESYHSYLNALHEAHPTWTFTAYNTGLDWSEVIRNEMPLSRNLIPGSVTSKIFCINGNYTYTPTAWADTDVAGAYNWTGNSWVVLSSPYWIQASTAAVSYVMDPRNWLNESNVFMFELLVNEGDIFSTDDEASYARTYNLLKLMMDESFMDCDYATVGGTKGKTYAAVLIEMAEKYGISPVHLCARIIQEKGRGTPNSNGEYILNNTLGNGVEYDGTLYYNFFNIGASGTSAEEILRNGTNEAVSAGWTSQYLAIDGGASKILNIYISLGQDTLYLQKFNVTDTDRRYWGQYMQNLLAPINEGYNIRNTYANGEYLNSNFEFKIPVYLNMPDTAVSSPDMDNYGNPNYKLRSISLTGDNKTYAMTPSFNRDTLAYTVVVPYQITSLDISASAISSTSIVTVAGPKTLNVGDNVFTINCKSEYGTSRNYKVTVTRLEGSTLLSGITGIYSDFSKDEFEYYIYLDNSITDYELAFSKESSYSSVVMRYDGKLTEIEEETQTEAEGETSTEGESTAAEATTAETTNAETTIAETTTAETTQEETTTAKEEFTGTLVLTEDKTPSLAVNEGDNVVYLDVYPGADDNRIHSTYTIHIVRYSQVSVDYTKLPIQESTGYINGFTIGDTVSQVAEKLAVTNGSVKVFKADGTQKADTDIIATSDEVVIYDKNGFEYDRHTAIVYGDMNADGKVNVLDFVHFRRQLVYGNDLSGVLLEAADMRDDDVINVLDFVDFRNYLVKNIAIKQVR